MLRFISTEPALTITTFSTDSDELIENSNSAKTVDNLVLHLASMQTGLKFPSSSSITPIESGEHLNPCTYDDSIRPTL